MGGQGWWRGSEVATWVRGGDLGQGWVGSGGVKWLGVVKWLRVVKWLSGGSVEV